ncbi:MAG: hypothetical protein OEY85_09065 [Rhodospirillales bacterium]|nr:hypothetical protein [Rhodospirillales bacterium]
MDDLVKDLADNTDPKFWSDKLDELETRVGFLLDRLSGPEYTEWGLLAVKALEGDRAAADRLGQWPPAGSELKDFMNELSLIYLTLPVVHRYGFRAESQKLPPG